MHPALEDLTHRRSAPESFGPRSVAAARGWGDWSGKDPFRLPSSTLRHAKKAWRIILRRQLRRSFWPWWRLWRVPVLLLQ
ncbi:unnamed protein product, partial [Effrenium voratum]